MAKGASHQKWVQLKGVLVEGYGVASGVATDSPYPRGSIEMQLPFFRALGLDLSGFYPATLNVRISSHAVARDKPSHTFRSVRWSANHQPEDFSFSPCRVVYQGREHPGFVYMPHEETKLRHHHDPSILEIITERVAGIGYGDELAVWVDAREFRVRSTAG